MAKIHKGIATGSGFAYKGKDLNFSRDVYDNFADLKYDASTYGFPDGFKTVVIDPADSQITREKYTTFIYANSKWKVASNVKLFDNVISDPMTEGISFTGINGITGIDILKGDKNVWGTNGGVVNLTEVENSVKSYVADNYTNTSTLNETLKSYAKLASANFTELKVGDKTVATQDWTTTTVDKAVATATSQALKYKNGIAQQTDIPTTGVEVGWVYVCTTEGDYTINGGTVHLEVGDTLICKSTTVSEMWTIVQANITGAVTKSGNLASGQLVVGTGLSSVKALDAGANGKFLKVENNALAWGDVPVYGLNNGSPTTNGLVPYDGSAKSGTFLRIDGTWEKPHDTTYDGATSTTPGLMTAADKVKLDGIEAEANKYVLHVATNSSLGGIKVGYTENAGEKKYKVQVSSDGKAFVYVPWTDTNTTYDDMKGATASSAGTNGLVPAPTAGQQGLFLCGNGKWEAPADTVYAAGTGISIDNKVIKNTGVISIVIDPESADTLLVNNGDRITIDGVTNASNAGHAETADTASKLSTSTAGNANTPVYFEGGVPKPLKFTIEKSVPSNAVFTDTIYTLSRNVDDHAKISLTSVNGSDTITIDNVAHATSADSATNAVHATSADSATNSTTATNAYIANHVANNLDVFTLVSPTSETKTQEYFNGSKSLTIDCVLPSEIEKMFKN